jgi:hypothetical protein
MNEFLVYILPTREECSAENCRCGFHEIGSDPTGTSVKDDSSLPKEDPTMPTRHHAIGNGRSRSHERLSITFRLTY